VNGGGHPQAAGCKPDIYDDMLDYAHHWTTEGQACKRVILSAFEAVAEAVADGPGDAGDDGKKRGDEDGDGADDEELVDDGNRES
jgi:hypothetical protein